MSNPEFEFIRMSMVGDVAVVEVLTHELRFPAQAQELSEELGLVVAQDWAAWQDALSGLERDWFVPTLEALDTGRLGELALTLGGDTGSVTLAATRGDLRKFWRRRVLASLFE